MANPPQTVSTVTAGDAELAAAGGGGRQPARGERRRAVAGGRRRRRRDRFQIGRRCAGRARCCCDCAPTTTPRSWPRWRRARRWRRSTTTATCGSSMPRRSARRWSTSDNYNLKNARAQADEQQAMVDEEDVARAVRRASGHPGGRSGPVSQSRAPRSSRCRRSIRCSSISTVPQQALSASRWARRWSPRSTRSPARHSAGRSSRSTRTVDTRLAQRADARQPAEPRSPAAARDVRDDRHRSRRARAAHHAAADRDHLQSVWQHGLPRGEEAARPRPGQPAAGRQAEFRHDRCDARRPGGGAERRQAGRCRRLRRPDQAAQRRAGGDQQHGAARRQSAPPSRSTAERAGDGRHALHRYLHPPPGAGDRRQPADPGARPARPGHVAGAAISADRERRGHHHHDLLRRRSRTSSPASSPRRWRTRSRRRTASTT